MNTSSDQPNRYAAPQSEVEDVKDDTEVGELAGRGERLGASLLDGLIFGVAVWLPMLIGFGFGGFRMLMEMIRNGGQTAGGDEVFNWAALFTGFAFAGIGFLIVLSINIYFVVKNRQTIGKKLVGIKVVRSDGSLVSIARLFWLRNFVAGLPGGIPYLGYLYSLARYLMIFGEQRRCIHDYIADTIVVKA
jgi:uncharacterized RDD family membrane protein YckC